MQHSNKTVRNPGQCIAILMFCFVNVVPVSVGTVSYLCTCNKLWYWTSCEL